MNTNPSPHTAATAHEIRVLSVDSLTSPRAVRNVLDGRAVKPLTRERVMVAVRARGWEHLLVTAAVHARHSTPPQAA